MDIPNFHDFRLNFRCTSTSISEKRINISGEFETLNKAYKSSFSHVYKFNFQSNEELRENMNECIKNCSDLFMQHCFEKYNVDLKNNDEFAELLEGKYYDTQEANYQFYIFWKYKSIFATGATVFPEPLCPDKDIIILSSDSGSGELSSLPSDSGSGELSSLPSDSGVIECQICFKELPNLQLSYHKLNEIMQSNNVSFHGDETEDYCSRHDRLYSILEGKYPFDINFNELPQRVNNFKKDLLKIIDNPTESEFYTLYLQNTEACDSKVKAIILFNTFEEFQPGYYGPRGSGIIMKELNKIFGQQRLDFIERVLVPESAIRLISEDYNNISLVEAENIRRESCQFGFNVHK